MRLVLSPAALRCEEVGWRFCFHVHDGVEEKRMVYFAVQILDQRCEHCPMSQFLECEWSSDDL